MARDRTQGQLAIHNEATLPPQEIIDLFKITFNDELYQSDERFEQLLKEIKSVKSDLYNRDYIEAFSSDPKRVAYCCRWSPPRATSYGSLLSHLEPVLNVIQCHDGADQNVLCVGGGAGSEFVSIASMFTTSRELTSKYHVKEIDGDDMVKKSTLNLHLVDIANWRTIIKRLNDSIDEKWLYNNESDFFKVKFTENDILKMNETCLLYTSRCV